MSGSMLWSQLRSFFQKVAARLDLSTRNERLKFDARRKAYYRSYWGDVVEAVGARTEDVGYNILKISIGEKHTFVRDYEVMLDNHLSLNMMGNKPLTHSLLSQSGFPVPRHLPFDLNTLDSAYEFYNKLGKPVVVKPAGGGAGKGVTTKIKDIKQIKKAAYMASVFHSKLLIEEQVKGASYRLLYLGGRLIDAVRRDPPTIVGDGSKSVRELIMRENDRRLSTNNIDAISPIVIDLDCKNKLHDQSLRLSDILEEGRIVVVKDVINQNSMRENHVIPISNIHPSTIALGIDIVEEFRLELIGLDIISQDISVPLQKNGGVINEINTTPGLHHHDLVAEQIDRTNVGEQVLNYIFSKYKSGIE